MKPTSVIKARLGIENGGKAHAYFTERCYTHMTKYVPGGAKSHLNQAVDIQADSITYESPGAHYLYVGKKYVDPKYKKGAFYSPNYGFWSRPGITKIPTSQDLIYHTPGTGARWDKRMWTAEGKEVVEEVQSYVDRGCR